MHDERELRASDEALIAYLRDGKPDAEIAVRLGLSVGEVRARIDSLVTRLGLHDRAGLHTWDGHVPSKPTLAAPATGEGGEEDVPPSRRPFALLAVAGALVLTAGLAAVALFASGGDAGEPPAAALEVATATRVPLPTVDPVTNAMVGGLPVTRVVATGGVYEVFDYLDMLVLVSCADCQGPELRLQRVYQLPGEATVVETLFTAPTDTTITGVAMGAEPGSLFVTTCWPGICATASDVRTLVHHSPDGGVTWEVLGEVRGYFEALADTRDGLVLHEASGDAGYMYFPSLEAVVPAGALILGTTREGEVVYLTPGSSDVVMMDEPVSLPPPENFAAGTAQLAAFLSPSDGAGFWVKWEDTASSHTRGVLVRMEDGKVARAILAGTPAAIEDSKMFGTFNGFAPGMIDLDTNTAYPLPGPWTSDSSNFYFLEAISTQPFARVSAVDSHGDCLAVRDAGGAPLACVAERVHVRVDRAALTGSSPGADWVAVTTPGGVAGWVPSAMLDLGTASP